MKISVGNDHRGYKLKKEIINYLEKKNIEYEDLGADSEDSSDYPDYGYKVAKSVSEGDSELGILICGSGIGMSIVANKVKGIRAGLCYTKEQSRLAKAHNDANILILKEGLAANTAFEMIDVWLNTEFESSGRHEIRIKKIHELTGL